MCPNSFPTSHNHSRKFFLKYKTKQTHQTLCVRGNKKHIWIVWILALKTLTLIKDFHSVQFTRNYLSRVNGFGFIITKFPNSVVLYSKQACILSLISLFSGSDFTQDWIQLLAELTVPKMLQCKLKKRDVSLGEDLQPSSIFRKHYWKNSLQVFEY